MVVKHGLELYKEWAPADGVWSLWAKPIMFMHTYGLPKRLNLQKTTWLEPSRADTMIIVDLPGSLSVLEGLSLAIIGYRPVPLYNSTPSPSKIKGKAMVDTVEIEEALRDGAAVLAEVHLNPQSPPAFLLDCARMRMKPPLSPGAYDNRWCVFPQDMPSAEYLLKQGIRNIVLRSDAVESDLAHILLRYQQNGISINLCDRKSDAMQPLTISKPLFFKKLWYRYNTIRGLKRNTAGGFGGIIPEPSSSSRMG